MIPKFLFRVAWKRFGDIGLLLAIMVALTACFPSFEPGATSSDELTGTPTSTSQDDSRLSSEKNTTENFSTDVLTNSTDTGGKSSESQVESSADSSSDSPTGGTASASSEGSSGQSSGSPEKSSVAQSSTETSSVQSSGMSSQETGSGSADSTQGGELPKITATPSDLYLFVGEVFQFTFEATGSQPLSWSLISAPSGMTIDKSSGQVIWTPENKDIGKRAVEVKVENRYGDASYPFELTVENRPTKPSITSDPVMNSYINSDYRYQVTAIGTPPIKYRLLKNPSGMSIGENSGLITWLPDKVGDFQVSVQAENEQGLSDPQNYILRVFAMSISAVNPNKGSTAGGTAISIEGKGFPTSGSVAVYIENEQFVTSEAKVVSSTQITAKTPAHRDSIGAFDVIVKFASGETVIMPAGFHYYYDPVGDTMRFSIASYQLSPNSLANQVAVCDLDQDDLPDAVIADSGAMTLWSLIGNGNLTFVAKAIKTDHSAFAVACADLNADDFPDVALTNLNEGTLSIFQNDQKGNLVNTKDYLVGSQPYALTLADFDHDGDLDVATANFSANNVTILVNDGNGNFPDPGIYNFSVVESPRGITSGDYNGDGKMDIAVISQTRNLCQIYVGKGDSTFDAATATLGTGISPLWVASGFMNQDDVSDLIVSADDTSKKDKEGNIYIFPSLGNGLFGSPGINDLKYLPAYSNEQPTHFSVGDINGDGFQDLAVNAYNSTPTKGLQVMLGDGSGKILKNLIWLCTLNQFYSALGDFDRDGDPDIIVTHGAKESVDYSILQVLEQVPE
jgi:hypothetical protein